MFAEPEPGALPWREVGAEVVIEFARSQCNLPEANTVEADPMAKHPLIHLMPGQRGIQDKGATMRLGAYPCRIEPVRGFVQDQQLGVLEERSRDPQPLLHPERVALHAAAAGTRQLDQLTHLVDPRGRKAGGRRETRRDQRRPRRCMSGVVVFARRVRGRDAHRHRPHDVAPE